MATAELMDGRNSRQQPPTIPSSKRAPNHAWEGRELGKEGREGGRGAMSGCGNGGGGVVGGSVG